MRPISLSLHHHTEISARSGTPGIELRKRLAQCEDTDAGYLVLRERISYEFIKAAPQSPSGFIGHLPDLFLRSVLVEFRRSQSRPQPIGKRPYARPLDPAI